MSDEWNEGSFYRARRDNGAWWPVQCIRNRKGELCVKWIGTTMTVSYFDAIGCVRGACIDHVFADDDK